ncbi:unnamed protein product [Symbiodinium sp. CCMP2592]|nr:unnamed protein product [Symbiodinium sp. CCMP2592]
MAQCLATLPLKEPFSADTRSTTQAADLWIPTVIIVVVTAMVILAILLLYMLLQLARLHRCMNDTQSLLADFRLPVLMQEPTLFPESVRIEVEKAHKALWKQLRDTQAMILRMQALMEHKLDKYERTVRKLIAAMHDLEPITERLQTSVNSVFDVLEDIFQEEERVFSNHTAQLIAAVDRLKYIVHQLLDRSERRFNTAQVLRQDVQKALVAVLNQNHRILMSLDVIPCEVEARLHQPLLRQLRDLLVETTDPLYHCLQQMQDLQQMQEQGRRRTRPDPAVPPPTAHEPSLTEAPEAHWVTLDDGSTLPVQPEA